MMRRLPVYILAGGRSSRFGSDKARATIDGKSMISRLIERLSGVATSVTVVSRRGEDYSECKARCIEDEFDFFGPLAGLSRALKDLVENGLEADGPWGLVVTCDLLEWHDVWLENLQSSADGAGMRLEVDEPLATAFRDGEGRWQPFPGLYHRRLLPIIASLLANEQRAMKHLLEDGRSHARAVEMTGLPAVRTANTREELERWVATRTEV